MSAAEQAVATETESSERSIRDELLAARDEIEQRNKAAEGEAEPESPVSAKGEETESTAEARAARVRDERGRFAPVADGAVEAPEQPGTVAAPVAAEPPADKPAEAVPQVIAAPPSWSNTAKAKWNELPTEVRAEIAKREADVHKGFTKMDEERAFGRELQKIMAPYEPLIRSEGGTHATAVQQLLNTAYILRNGDPLTKARVMAETCQRFGVDFSVLGNAQQPQQVDPQVATLQQELAQLKGYISQQQQSEQARIEQDALQTVEAFKSDPAHAYFDAVQGRMAELLTSGVAKDLSQAYETAVWERPDLRQQLLAKQAQPQATGQNVSRLKAEKARTKAVSVRGGAGGVQPTAPNPNASVREDLEAAFREASGRI